MGHTHISLGVHLVWATKHRQMSLAAEWRKGLFHYMAGIARNKGARLLAAGGIEDHVHLYVSLPSTLSVASLVNAFKANSSRWIHETIPGLRRFEWQIGYAAFSVNRADDRQLIAYIQDQESHHSPSQARRADTLGGEPHP